MYEANAIAERIKKYAKKNKVQIKIMLEKCGLSKNTLSSMQSGGSTPKSENLAKIADYLDCSVDYLLGRSDTTQLTVSDDEHFVALIKYYEALNETGRSEAEKRIEELTQIPKYTKPERQEEYNIG